MIKKKMKATVMVADGAGGMTPVHDKRFEGGDWPIHFEIPTNQADHWFLYLQDACTKRGWYCGSMRQLGAKENSGTITVNTGGNDQPQLAIVWERRRSGPINLKARSVGTAEFALDQANEVFASANEASASGKVTEHHRVGLLAYDRLPWRGELWLSNRLRLGPPAKHDDRCLTGPQIIVVNAMVAGIDGFHANSMFDVFLRELSVFLTVVTGTRMVVTAHSHRDWIVRRDPESNEVSCEPGDVGYLEIPWPLDMPQKGVCPPVPLRAIARPDLSIRGICDETEEDVPEDIVELWQAFETLPPDRRRQFIQAGNMWQLALSVGRGHETARFALMVAACEGLKPTAPEFRNRNFYDVVEALIGKATSESLRRKTLPPQDVRNSHLHTGAFHGSEFQALNTFASFDDPTFYEVGRELYQVTQASLIEWLRLKGDCPMPLPKRKRRWRRLVKRIAIAVCPLVGVGFGWLLCRWFG